MSAYILEIKAVLARDDGPVAYGVDDLGRGFAIALDHDLAAEIATELDNGRRPIVAVESGLPIPPASGRSSGMAKRPPGTDASLTGVPRPASGQGIQASTSD